MSQYILFNQNNQKVSFENTSNNLIILILTNLNQETLTHSADSLNLMFSDSDQTVTVIKIAMQSWTLRL